MNKENIDGRINIIEDELFYLKEKDVENRKLITKMFENNEKILESFVYKNEEIDRKLLLISKFIANMCDPETDTTEFLISHAIDIYKCDLICFFSTYLMKNSMLMKSDISYSKWYKLNFLYNLVLQGYQIELNENDKNIFLLKIHKLFTDTDVSTCPHPYNSKDQFIKNTIFKICLNRATVLQ